MGECAAFVSTAAGGCNRMAELVAIDATAVRQDQANGVVVSMDDGGAVARWFERTTHAVQDDTEVVCRGIAEVIGPELIADILARQAVAVAVDEEQEEFAGALTAPL